MSQPVDLREVLISLATAALLAAESDAAQTGQLIFRDEWKPTPRTRSSITQSQSTPPNAGAQRQPSWLSAILDRMGPSWTQNQPSPPSHRTTLPASASRPASVTKRPPPAARPAFSAPPKRLPQLEEDAVGKLLKDNDDVFDRLINHPFPQALGDGSASLDGFRYYMIQDTLYLEACARLKMAAVAWSPNFKDVENFLPRHMSSLEYVTKSKEILTSMLGMPENIIDTTPRSKNLDASEKFYRDSVQKEDAFFAYYVVLLPCVLSYWRIAERLMDNPSTVRNVVYHPAWIEINYDRSSADKYIKFINANIMAKGGVDRWNYIFRIACQLEADLFNTGLQAPTPYQIVPNGTYSIQGSFATGKVVLSNQSMESSGAYHASNNGSSIVGVNDTGGAWHVVATKLGYTFQNVETGHYLGITPELGQKGRLLLAVVNPYYWWINPVRSQLSNGFPLYQIYESGNLRYTLHADQHILGVKSTNLNHASIIAHDNFEGPCQMWSFELVQLEPPDAVNPSVYGGEKTQDPLEEAQEDIDNSEEIAKKISEFIERYERFMREEFETIEPLRMKYSEEVGRELLVEARRNLTATGNEVKEKLVELVEKHERVLGQEFEAVERQRRERDEKKRQELFEEAQKFTSTEGAQGMAELCRKYEQLLQTEYEAIEQSRRESSKKARWELFQEVCDGGIDMMAEKYEGILQEEIEVGGQLRQLYHEQLRQELLAEASQRGPGQQEDLY